MTNGRVMSALGGRTGLGCVIESPSVIVGMTVFYSWGTHSVTVTTDTWRTLKDSCTIAKPREAMIWFSRTQREVTTGVQEILPDVFIWQV